VDFGDGGSLMGRIACGDYKGVVIERIKDKYIPKAKYQVFSDLVKVL
jgi:hypothetical protein